MSVLTRCVVERENFSVLSRYACCLQQASKTLHRMREGSLVVIYQPTGAYPRLEKRLD